MRGTKTGVARIFFRSVKIFSGWSDNYQGDIGVKSVEGVLGRKGSHNAKSNEGCVKVL